MRSRSILNAALLVCLFQATSLSAFTLHKAGSNLLTLGDSSATDSGNITGTITATAFAIDSGGGTVRPKNASAIGSDVPVSIADGTTLDLATNSVSISIGSLTGGDGAHTAAVSLGAQTLTVNQTTNTAFDGVISGTGGVLAVSGAGTLTLSYANTYTGGTNLGTGLSAGKITLNNSSGLGTGTLTMAGTTTLTLQNSVNAANAVVMGGTPTVIVSSGTGTLSGGITYNATMLKTGDGILAITAGGSGTGGVNLNAGQITLGSSTTNALGTGTLTMAASTTLALGSSASAANPVTISGDATVNVSTGTTGTLSGGITYNALMSKTGDGILAITTTGGSGTGGVNLNAGQITLGSSTTNALGTGTLTMAASTTLALGSSASAANPVTISGAATVDVSTGTTGTLSGGITYNALMSKTGDGILAITAGGSGSGGVNLNAGQITLGNSTGLGTGTLAMSASTTLALGSGVSAANPVTVGGAATVDVSSGTGTLGGGITYTAAMTKTGSGTLAITASGSNSGGVSLNAGTISLGHNTGLGTSTLTMADGTTLAIANGINGGNAISINASGTGTISVATGETGTYSGATAATTGALTKSGTGTLIITGNNHNTGVTTISDGTLALSGSGVISDSTAVVVNGTLDISAATVGSTVQTLSGSGAIALGSKILSIVQGSDGTFSGSIGGTGSLSKSGSGTLTLTGSNSYSGGTTISAGTLTGNSESLGTGTITCNATINLNQTSDGTLTDTITGTGALIKTGSAVLTLSGAVTQNSAAINAGQLAVTGTLAASTTTVASGALLTGIGTVGRKNATFTNNGTVRPGSSIGTLHILGDYVATSGSILEIEFDPTNADFLDIAQVEGVGGTITIQPGAILSLFPDPVGVYSPNKTYPIISAAGGGGTSGAQFIVQSSLPSFTGTVLYSANFIRLRVNVVPFATLVTSGNANQVAQCLDGVTPTTGSDLNEIVDSLLFMHVPEMEGTMNMMQPSLFNGFDLMEEETLVNVRQAITKWQSDLNRKNCASNNQVQFWNSYFYTQTNQATIGSNPGFHTSTQAGMTGAHYRGHSNAFGGAAFAFTDDSIRWKNHYGSGRVDSYYGSAYAGIKEQKLYLQIVGLAGANHYDGHRNILFPETEIAGFTRTANHENWGWSALGGLEAGFFLPFASNFECQPFGRFDYTYFHRNAATETGADSLDLYLDPHNAQMVSGEIGLDFFGCYHYRSGVLLPKAKLAYVFERRYSGAYSQANFLFSPSCVMNVLGLQPDRELFTYSAGLDVSLFTDALLLGFEWAGEWGDGYLSSNTTAQLKWSF